MKAFWLVLFMILLGTGMQSVKAVEEDISIRQELDHTIETDLAPQLSRPADRNNSLKRTEFSEGIKEQKDDHQKSKRTSARRDPRTLEENSQGRDPVRKQPGEGSENL